MTTQHFPSYRSSKDTKARIVFAAQTLFSQKGYAETGLREIAQEAQVAGSLLIKHFKSKANLFEEALTNAITHPAEFHANRSTFGKAVVAAMDDRELKTFAPAMMALSLGDEEAKTIIANVSRRCIITPMADWLGGEHAEARARYMLMLSMGYVTVSRQMSLQSSAAERKATARMVINALQGAVDGDSVARPSA